MVMRLSLLSFVAVVALCLGGLGQRWFDTTELLAATGYWAMLLLFLLWGASMVVWLRRNGVGWWGRIGWRGVLLIGAAWLFLVSREPAEFKVVMDEPMLMGASLGMHLDRTPVVPRAVYELAGQGEVQPGQIDKRPLLFPFLLSLLHDLLGYHVGNVFLLNRALVLVLVLLAWLAGRSLDPAAGGPLLLLWLCGWPLLAQNACGGGFEVLNLVLILLTFLAAVRYLRERCAENEVFLLLTCLLLANTRYESVLFLAVFAGAWIVGGIRNRDWAVSWVTVCSPLLLVPFFWQRVMVATSDRYMELGARGVEHVLGLGYIPANLAHAWRFLGVPDPTLAGSPLFAGLGLLALLGLPFVALRTRGSGALGPLLGTVAVVLAGFGVLMTYFWGQLDDTVASRLALPLIGAMGLALCAGRAHWLPSRGGARFLFAVMGAWFVGYVLPVANEHRYTQNVIHMRIFDWSREVIGRTGARHPLVIGTHARIWTAYRAAALTPKLAWGAMERIAYQRRIGTFDEVFVVQSLVYDPRSDGYVPLPGNALPDGVTLEPLAESSFHTFNRVRISRLRSVDLEQVERAGPPRDEPTVVFQDLGPEERRQMRERTGLPDRTEGVTR